MKSRLSQGYTLPEILIVLVIIGIISASTFSGWQRWQQQRRLADTAQQIQHFLYRLRSHANWHNVEQVLWLKNGARWCLGGSRIAVEACQPGKRTQLIAPYTDVALISITPGMGFYGRRNVAKPGSIVLSNAAGSWRIIVSSRGRIRLCKTAQQERCQ